MSKISKEFLPFQLGETKKVVLKNGSSITTKWEKENKYIIRYKPENYADYFSPYFLFEFEDGMLKRTIPFPNKRSFVYMILILIGFVLYKGIKPDMYLTFFSFSIIFTFILQIVVGLPAYRHIMTNVFEKNEK
ncbi:hypothetical protein [Algibacter sp. R77976]|uniref:hypothetical protein n=1 Tax=Algibacter sp. R77976 TaxID=3093873 RepID=UPI0037CB5C98